MENVRKYLRAKRILEDMIVFEAEYDSSLETATEALRDCMNDIMNSFTKEEHEILDKHYEEQKRIAKTSIGW